MAVSDVDRESVLEALKYFDGNLRPTPEWSDWERRYDYAIEVEDRRYPAKQILSIATGESNEDFPGGDQTNQPLLNLGFKIVDLRDLSTDSNFEGDLQQSLGKILTLYGEVRRSKPFGVDTELWSAFKKTLKLLTASVPIKTRPTVKVTWSVGKGTWAQVPWIAFLDSRNTTSTTTGVYAVLLF